MVHGPGVTLIHDVSIGCLQEASTNYVDNELVNPVLCALLIYLLGRFGFTHIMQAAASPNRYHLRII